MEPTPSVPSSCAQEKNKFTGTWLCHYTRQWRTFPYGCRRYSPAAGKKCRGIRGLINQWSLAGAILPRSGNVQRQQRWCFRLGERRSCACRRFEHCVVTRANVACDASLGTRCFGGDEVNLTGSRGNSFLIEWASRLQGPDSTNSTE